MTLGDLITECRERLDDQAQPYLWTDEQLTRWLNEAVTEAADRAYLIYDETTPAVCQIAVAIGTQSYAMHPSIIRVESAALASDTCDLYRDEDVLDADTRRSSWRYISGKATSFGILGQTLYLNFVPSATDTLTLRVRRLPLDTEMMVDTTDEPIISTDFHSDLAHWALYKAFIRKDADAQSSSDAEVHLGFFEARFGKKPSARAKNTMRSQRRRGRMHSVRFGG